MGDDQFHAPRAGGEGVVAQVVGHEGEALEQGGGDFEDGFAVFDLGEDGRLFLGAGGDELDGHGRGVVGDDGEPVLKMLKGRAFDGDLVCFLSHVFIICHHMLFIITIFIHYPFPDKAYIYCMMIVLNFSKSPRLSRLDKL